MRTKIAFILLAAAPCAWVYGIVHTVRHNSPAILYGLALAFLFGFMSFAIATGGRE